MTERRQMVESAKKRGRHMQARDALKDRVTHERARDLNEKRRLREVERQEVRNRILGRPLWYGLRTKLEAKPRARDPHEVARIEREGNLATLHATEENTQSTGQLCASCANPFGILGGDHERIRERYALLDDLRTISPRRTRTCRRKRCRETVQIIGRNGKIVISGVETCGSVHSCPVCAAKIYAIRAAEIDSCVERWIGWGDGRIGPAQAWCGLLTLTISHGLGDSLAETQRGISNAFRFLFAGREGQALKRDLGIKHFARSCESTYGANGWHPHLHVLTMTDKPPTPELFERLTIRWIESVTRALGSSHAPSREHGLDLSEITRARDGRYIAKMGLEIAGGIETKGAAMGNRTYWQIGKDAAKGDRKAVALWQEAQTALFRSRQLTWSRGTKAKFGLADLDDLEVVLLEEDGVLEETSKSVATLELDVPGSKWDEGCRRDRRFLSRVVGAASEALSTGDWSGLVGLVGRDFVSASTEFLGGGLSEKCGSSAGRSSAIATCCSAMMVSPMASLTPHTCL